MAPRYLPINQQQQMTYVLDTGNLNLAQVQLATVPASEILLIQDKNDSTLGLCESPVLVATDVSPGENVGWLGNNVLVLMSQPQEYVMVEQEVVLESGQTWQVEGGGTVCVSSSRLAAKQGEEGVETAEEEPSATTLEDAKCWFRDSLITTAALSTLTTYVQANGQAKVG
ncbi:hypothetical protein JTE90_011462 [Oedothorax gibbosus]|uniref:Uncharacterized protein n=1 Tax=Oedothorax gibbosus TaxID=931172 RepID=A0AAV6VB94_9ARAC|nr:hypothetical protein JTE90_011462 [Oedothorax gibbosus]